MTLARPSQSCHQRKELRTRTVSDEVGDGSMSNHWLCASGAVLAVTTTVMTPRRMPVTQLG